MKTLFITLIAICLFTVTSNAQWAGTAPNAVLSSGYTNVGIGTSSPAGKLQVQSSSWDLLTSANSLDIGTGGITSNWARAFRIANSSGSDGTDGGAFGVRGVGAKPIFVYMAIPSSTSTIGYTSTKIVALDSLGNVGIGINTPGKKLDVIGDARIRGDQATLNFYRATSPTDIAYIRYDNTVGAFSAAANSKTFNINNGASFATNLTVLASGKVGIGTLNPDQALTVNGQVHSTSVVVTSTVPADYVFNSNYYLRPLTEVKNYVDKNHHLPEVPAAADFKKDGQNLGEMNMLLLRKVEELTLYLLEKDKKEKEQEGRINKLEKQLTKLGRKNNLKQQ